MKFRIILYLALVLSVLPALHYYNLWPFHLRARPTASIAICLNNLRQIDAAVNQWALEHGKHVGDSVTLEDIKPYIKLNSRGEIPSCPEGGKYSVTLVGTSPTCSLGTDSITRSIHDYFYGEDSYFKASRFHRLP